MYLKLSSCNIIYLAFKKRLIRWLFDSKVLLANRKGNKRLSFLCFYPIGCKVFICDFHREQAWDRWLKKIANECSEIRLKIIALLRSIARADTVNDCEKAINSLKESTYWLENANFREYISKYWLNIKEVFLLILMGKTCCWKIFQVFADKKRNAN